MSNSMARRGVHRQRRQERRRTKHNGQKMIVQGSLVDKANELKNLSFLAYLVYQPKSLIQSCFVCHHHWHCLGAIVCAHLPLAQG